jgi:hypothetical protein
MPGILDIDNLDAYIMKYIPRKMCKAKVKNLT